MPFQVCVGTFKVIARTAADAVKLYDRFCDDNQTEVVYVADMGGLEVDVDQLRAEPPADCTEMRAKPRRS